MNADRLNELTAAFASGELQPAEELEFRALLTVASDEEKALAANIMDGASLFALSIPAEHPPVFLREKVLAAIGVPAATPDLFEFMLSASEGSENWTSLRVPGAKVKLLSLQSEKGYAVVLGKLAPITYYPAHQHLGAEQIYVLEGDLKIGEVTLKAGDFHNARAGSSHGINVSTKGCTILAILSTEDFASLSVL